MRTAFVLVTLVAAGLFSGGCRSSSGCGTSCEPKTECCWTWQPNCCNSWDWYVPCDLIEGREYRKASPCEPVPTCRCP